METLSGPFNFGVLLVTLVAFNVAFKPGTVVVFTNGVNVFVGDTVAFPGSFFGWATHPVARIQPTAMSRVRSVIIFIGGSPF
jgi:hypothetical protein